MTNYTDFVSKRAAELKGKYAGSDLMKTIAAEWNKLKKSMGFTQRAGGKYAGSDCHINPNNRCINGGPNDAANCKRNPSGRCARTGAAKKAYPIRATAKQLENLAYGRNVRATGGLARMGDVFGQNGGFGNCGINPATNYCKSGLGPSEFCVAGKKRCQKVKGSGAPKGTRNPTQREANRLGWIQAGSARGTGCQLNAGTRRCNKGFDNDDEFCNLNISTGRCNRNKGVKPFGPMPKPSAKVTAAARRNIGLARAQKLANEFGRIQVGSSYW